ncbi:MAG: DsbA family protein [Rhodobacterales bacterium]|nr:MAG: DsbA family protein [Rhodobacterales bacterium]
MRRLATLGILTSLVVSLAAPTLADGPTAMTQAERDALRAEVRAYLLENPEVLIEAMNILNEREETASAERDAQLLQTKAAEIFSSPTDWVGGNPEGDITLVEFMDYRCTYCRKAHDEVQSLVNTDGNIRYVIKEFPILGEGSLVSSQFAISVRLLHGDVAYKAAHDALIDLRGEPTPETLTRLATDLGHDPAPILAKMPTDEVMSVISTNHALADQLQISGTPTFVLKDMMLRGYVPLEGMQQIVAGVRQEG